MNLKTYNYSKAICGYLAAALDLLDDNSPPSDYAQALVFWANLKRVKQPWTSYMRSRYPGFKNRIDDLLTPQVLKGCLADITTAGLEARLGTIREHHRRLDTSDLTTLCENWIQDRDELNTLLVEIGSRLLESELPPDYYRIRRALESIDRSGQSQLESFLPAAPMIKHLRSIYQPEFLHAWWWRLSQRKLKSQESWWRLVRDYFQGYPDHLFASTDEPVQMLDIPVGGVWKFWTGTGLELALVPYRGQLYLSAIGDRLDLFLLKSIWIDKEPSARSDIARIQSKNMTFFPLGRFEDECFLTIWFEINKRDYSLDLEMRGSD